MVIHKNGKNGCLPKMQYMNNQNLLIVFAKNLEIGSVKTRIAKTTGNEVALKIYNSLLRYTLEQCKPLRNCSLHIYYTNYTAHTDESDFMKKKMVQQGHSLGERMKNAFEKSFQRGFKKIVLIGSDCPEIKTQHIEKAFHFLATHQTVVGPATDGGYYLLGLNTFYPELFTNMPWSNHSLMQKTEQFLVEKKIPFFLLEELSDVDTEEDAKRFNLL